MDFPDLGLNTHPVSAREAWLGVTGAGTTPDGTFLSRVKPVRGRAGPTWAGADGQDLERTGEGRRRKGEDVKPDPALRYRWHLKRPAPLRPRPWSSAEVATPWGGALQWPAFPAALSALPLVRLPLLWLSVNAAPDAVDGLPVQSALTHSPGCLQTTLLYSGFQNDEVGSDKRVCTKEHPFISCSACLPCSVLGCKSVFLDARATSSVLTAA